MAFIETIDAIFVLFDAQIMLFAQILISVP
jgi:hypothetical protein